MSTPSRKTRLSGPLKITLFSFGFKHGPPDADTVWDVRFLPNPYWDTELKPFTGLDERVARYALDNETGDEFLALLEPMILFLIRSFSSSKKEKVRIGIGCTGGKHRSVAVTQHMARVLNEQGVQFEVFHRDIDKE